MNEIKVSHDVSAWTDNPTGYSRRNGSTVLPLADVNGLSPIIRDSVPIPVNIIHTNQDSSFTTVQTTPDKTGLKPMSHYSESPFPVLSPPSPQIAVPQPVQSTAVTIPAAPDELTVLLKSFLEKMARDREAAAVQPPISSYPPNHTIAQPQPKASENHWPSLRIPFLVGAPVAPTKNVFFKSHVFGDFSFWFHEVVVSENMVSLFQDTRWQQGPTWHPPNLGSAATIYVSFDGLEFDCYTLGLNCPLGVISITNLIKKEGN